MKTTKQISVHVNTAVKYRTKFLTEWLLLMCELIQLAHPPKAQAITRM